jgi:glycosyltransferase involved in cell wall biosynthesis
MATLSLILPNYNDGALIRSALARFVAQTRPVEEIIVVDDGSTDDSLKKIKNMANANTNIRTIVNATNMGAVEAVKTAIGKTTTDYVYLSAVDDGIGPQFVEKLLGLAEKYPSAGLCCSDTVIRGRLRKTPMRHGFKSGFLPPKVIATTLNGQHIYSTGTIFRRDVLHGSHMFDAALRWHTDWFANMVIAFRNGLAFLPEIHSFITHRPNSFSNRGRKNWALQADLMEHVFSLLNSQEFKDILPAFIQSKAMNHFGGDAWRLLQERPHLMTETNMLLAGGLKHDDHE